MKNKNKKFYIYEIYLKKLYREKSIRVFNAQLLYVARSIHLALPTQEGMDRKINGVVFIYDRVCSTVYIQYTQNP